MSTAIFIAKGEIFESNDYIFFVFYTKGLLYGMINYGARSESQLWREECIGLSVPVTALLSTIFWYGRIHGMTWIFSVP
jgi:hypothetical protein